MENIKKVPQAAALINLLRKFSFVHRYAVTYVVFPKYKSVGRAKSVGFADTCKFEKSKDLAKLVDCLEEFPIIK